MAKPYNLEEDKKSQVRAMFNSIALRYDFLNHFLSFGIDIVWRKKLISMLKQYQPKAILDVATGTADLAIMASKSIRQSQITGIDLSEGMIDIGQVKVANQHLNERIQLIVGDSELLPFENEQFDAVMVSFGVRNFENLNQGLLEMNRVLKAGQPLLILEFSKPRLFPMKQLYHFYSYRLLPLIGRLVSKDSRAYTYLPESIAEFPSGKDLIQVLEACGYVNCRFKSLSFGISTIYLGHKAILG